MIKNGGDFKDAQRFIATFDLEHPGALAAAARSVVIDMGRGILFPLAPLCLRVLQHASPAPSYQFAPRHRDLFEERPSSPGNVA